MSFTDSFLKTLLSPIQCRHRGLRRLHSYRVVGAHIVIGLSHDSSLVYCIDEPAIDRDSLELAERLAQALLYEGYSSIPSLEELKSICKRYGVRYDAVRKRFQTISYYVAKALTGYGPLFPLIRDPNVEEIAVNGPGKPITVLSRLVPGRWALTNIILGEDVLNTLALQLAYRAGRSLSIAHPYVEGMLPEGHRIAVTYLKEVSRFGSSIVIRKHLGRPLTPTELIKNGMVSALELAYLWLIVGHGGSMLIVGSAAAGKTTLLQAILMLIPFDKRVVTIEDTPELNLSWHPHWDSLVTRHSYGAEAEDVDLYKLSKFALRRRADYLVIGEVRGEEAKVLVHAAASGHGALATFHAESAEAALTRLKAPPISIGESFLQALWLIATVARIRRNGVERRRLVAVDEIVPTSNGVKLQRIISGGDDVDAETIVEKSYRLARLREVYGLTRNDVVGELEERRAFLHKLVSENVLDVSEFVSRIRSFYASRYGVK